MEAMWLRLLVGTLMYSVRCQADTQPMCSQQPTSSLQLDVTSVKSQVGNWITKVDLERGGGRGLADSTSNEPWSVHVDCTTTNCEGGGASLHVSLTLTAPLQKVRSDYVLIPGVGYYKYHTIVTTWPLARKICAEEGAHLAIMNNAREADAMKTLHTRFPDIVGATVKDWVWIGIERRADEEFYTIFGDPLNSTGFVRWHPGQPNKGQYCGLILITSGNLGDTVCTNKQSFICEFEM